MIWEEVPPTTGDSYMAAKTCFPSELKLNPNTKMTKNLISFLKIIVRSWNPRPLYMEKILEVAPTIPKETIDTAHSLVLDLSSMVKELAGNG